MLFKLSSFSLLLLDKRQSDPKKFRLRRKTKHSSVTRVSDYRLRRKGVAVIFFKISGP